METSDNDFGCPYFEPTFLVPTGKNECFDVHQCSQLTQTKAYSAKAVTIVLGRYYPSSAKALSLVGVARGRVVLVPK